MSKTYTINANGSDAYFTVHTLPDTDWTVTASDKIISSSTSQFVSSITGSNTETLTLKFNPNQSANVSSYTVNTKITSNDCSGVTEEVIFNQNPLFLVKFEKLPQAEHDYDISSEREEGTLDSYELTLTYDGNGIIEGQPVDGQKFTLTFQKNDFYKSEIQKITNKIWEVTSYFGDEMLYETQNTYYITFDLDISYFDPYETSILNETIVLTTKNNTNYTITLNLSIETD